MKLLVTAYSNIGLGGFRQEVIEYESVESFVGNTSPNEMIEILDFSPQLLESLEMIKPSNIAPNFLEQGLDKDNTIIIEMKVKDAISKQSPSQISILVQSLE